MIRCLSQRSQSISHTQPSVRGDKKPIQNPYGHGKRPYGSILQGTKSGHKENAGSRCGTTTLGAKTNQGTTKENGLGRIGKDEVSSSNLDSSSKKLLKSLDFRSFYSIFLRNNVCQKVGQPL